jgi:hypothetical protein
MKLSYLFTLLLLLSLPALAQSVVEPGFERIFDGRSLAGWDGDPTYWSVEDGALVGTVTPETLLDRNTFIIWRGGELADFELRLEYRITDSGNSGINYRSVEVPGVPYAVRGYQADIHGGDMYTGNVYEERGRTFLALRGQKTIVEPGEVAQVVELFGAATDLQAWVRKQDGWNDVRIVARGGHVQQYINGRLFTEVIDNDQIAGRRKGLLGVQVHVGPPMKVEYRDIRVKHLGDAKIEPVGFDEMPGRMSNSDVLPLIETQVGALLKPGPNGAVGGRDELVIRSRPRYVRGLQTDLVLEVEGMALKIPAVPVALRNLENESEYSWELAWADGGYRVTRVTREGVSVYLAP